MSVLGQCGADAKVETRSGATAQHGSFACLQFVFTLLAISSTCVGISACSTTANLKPDGPPIFYPDLPIQPRSQFLFAIDSEKDLLGEPSAFEEILFGEAISPYTLEKPYAAAFQGTRIYVLDTIGSAVMVIDLEERAFYPLAGDVEGPNKLLAPTSIEISPNGHKFIVDKQLHKVLEYDEWDDFVRSIGSEDTLTQPADVAVLEDKIFVTDVKEHHVDVFDRATGGHMFAFGELGGDEPYKLAFPTFIETTSQGDVYVTDTMHFRIAKFDADGEYIGQVGQLGDVPGTFARPKGIAVDTQDRLHVVDAAFSNVQVFDDAGQLLMWYGSMSGHGMLYMPMAVDVSTERLDYYQQYADPRLRLESVSVVVSQFGYERIAVFGFGEWVGTLPDPDESEESGSETQKASEPLEPVLKPVVEPPAEQPTNDEPASDPAPDSDEPASDSSDTPPEHDGGVDDSVEQADTDAEPAADEVAPGEGSKNGDGDEEPQQPDDPSKLAPGGEGTSEEESATDAVESEVN